MSALAFTVAISSVNPAVYMSTVEDYGTEDDAAAYGLTGLLSIPLIPLIVGIILGNIDTDFAKVFTPGIGAILPLLGWNLGQGMNLVVALQSGVSGLLLTVIFLIINSYLFVFDNKVLKNDGVAGLALLNVAGVSTSTPAVIGTLFPAMAASYVSSATSQVMLVCVITSILTPIITQWHYKRYYGEKALNN